MRFGQTCIWTARSALVFALLLAGCDGGSPSPAPTPTPATPNAAPVFTSATTATAKDGATGAIYTAAASDADGDPLTYSLGAEGDSSLFVISATGALSFRSEPVFSDPKDQDTDNKYEVTIQVSDGKSAAVKQNVSVTVISSIVVKNVNRIGSATSRRSLIAISDTAVLGGGTEVINGNEISSLLWFAGFDSENGVSVNRLGAYFPGGPGLVLDPNYAVNYSYYYVSFLRGELKIARFKKDTAFFNGTSFCEFYCSETVVLKMPAPFAAASALPFYAWMRFGPDGYLYVALPDGENSSAPRTTAQDPTKILGKILRIDVNRDDFPGDPNRNYGIPADNPFATSGGAPEVWALGLHNPQGLALMPNGDVIFTDSGKGFEEVNILPTGAKLVNFGWPYFDGTASFVSGSISNAAVPAAVYPHGTGPRAGNEIVAGTVVTRTDLGSLTGRYFFADRSNSNFWSIPVTKLAFGSTVHETAFELRTSNFSVFSSGLAIGPVAAIGRNGIGLTYMTSEDGFILQVAPAP